MIDSINEATTMTTRATAFRFSVHTTFWATSLLVSALAVPNFTGEALAQASAENGKKVFKKCKACHTVGPGAKNRVGPTLNGIIGRKAGTVEGFKYSKANIKAGEEGWIWTEAVMLKYLESPRKAMPGNKMAFPGLKKEQDRKDLVEYLKSFKTSSNESKVKTTKVAAKSAAADKAAPKTSAKRSSDGTTSKTKAASAEKPSEQPTQPVVSWVGGATPSERPSSAPRVEKMIKNDAWYARALFGLSKPYPVSFRFLEDQGGWFTPFNRPGMTGPYDLRDWHSR